MGDAPDVQYRHLSVSVRNAHDQDVVLPYEGVDFVFDGAHQWSSKQKRTESSHNFARQFVAYIHNIYIYIYPLSASNVTTL